MKLKYILIFVLTFLFMVPDVDAVCGIEDMNRIQKVANNVKFTNQFSKDENGNDTGYFDLIISGLTEEIYLVDEKNGETYYYDFTDNGTIKFNSLSTDNYKFEIYSKECEDYIESLSDEDDYEDLDDEVVNEPIRTINHKIPKYNRYANNQLCNGITEIELDVCNRLYQGELTDEKFEKIVKDFREEYLNEKPEEETNILNKIMNFLENYYMYIIGGVILIVIAIVAIILNRKRGALE